MEFKSYLSAVKGGKIPALTFLYGEESYYAEQLIKLTVNKMVHFELNYSNYKEVFDVESFCRIVETTPLMDGVRLNVINKTGIFKWLRGAEQEQLIAALSTIPTMSHVIIYEPQIDRTTKLYKFLKKHSEMVHVKKLTAIELRKWLQKKFKEVDIRCEQTVYQTMITHSEYLTGEGKTLYEMIGAIQYFQSLQREITIGDVEQYFGVPAEYSIFRLFDAIGTESSLFILTELLDNGEVPLRLLHALGKQIRNAYKVKKMLREGYDINTCAQKIGCKPFVAQKALQGAGRLSFRKLQQVMEEVKSCDTLLKSTDVNPEMLLQRVLIAAMEAK